MCNRLADGGSESELVDADELWVKVISILYSDQGHCEDDPQCGWSLDSVAPLLAFLGCIKSVAASKYAEAMIQWMQRNRSDCSDSADQVDNDSIATIEQGAVVYSQTCHFNSVTREQLRDEGLLTKQGQKKLHEAWIYKRHSKKPADIVCV